MSWGRSAPDTGVMDVPYPILVPGAYLTIRVLTTPPLPQAPGVVGIYPLVGSANLATIHRVAEKTHSRKVIYGTVHNPGPIPLDVHDLR